MLRKRQHQGLGIALCSSAATPKNNLLSINPLLSTPTLKYQLEFGRMSRLYGKVKLKLVLAFHFMTVVYWLYPIALIKRV